MKIYLKQSFMFNNMENIKLSYSTLHFPPFKYQVPLREGLIIDNGDVYILPLNIPYFGICLEIVDKGICPNGVLTHDILAKTLTQIRRNNSRTN